MVSANEIEKARSVILTNAVEFFRNKTEVKAIFLEGSIPANETDVFSDIDLRIVVSSSAYNKIINERKRYPLNFGSFLFNEWDENWPNICVSHYLPFNKLDIVYYKPSDLEPSPWYTLPLRIIYDPDKIIHDLVSKSKGLSFTPNVSEIEATISKAIAQIHEIYRRIIRQELLYAIKIIIDLEQCIVKSSDWLKEMVYTNHPLSKCEKRLPDDVKSRLYNNSLVVEQAHLLIVLDNLTDLFEQLLLKLHEQYVLQRDLKVDMQAIKIVKTKGDYNL